ncbi:MAG: replication factor C small subunit [Promethearchaeota archaeon]
MSDLLWSEKYRPRSLDSFVGNEEVTARLKDLVKKGGFPHLMFSGPRESGKLSAARCVAREVLGDAFAENYVEVFADEPLTQEERKEAARMSRVSSNVLGSAAGKTFSFPKFLQLRVKPVMSTRPMRVGTFKLLVIHDFDVLKDEQQGMRRLMEVYGRNCRVVLLATNPSKVIDPLLSRTQLFLFHYPTIDQYVDFLAEVARNERIKVERAVLQVMYQVTKKRLGTSLNLLQVCSAKRSEVTVDVLYEELTQLEPTPGRELLWECFSGDFSRVLKRYRTVTRKHEYSRAEVFASLSREAFNLPLSRDVKAALADVIAKHDAAAAKERVEDLHLNALLARLTRDLGKKL